VAAGGFLSRSCLTFWRRNPAGDYDLFNGKTTTPAQFFRRHSLLVAGGGGWISSHHIFTSGGAVPLYITCNAGKPPTKRSPSLIYLGVGYFSP